MMRKLSLSLFAFLFLLLSFVRSETEVNPQLQLDFNCSTSSNPCDSKNALCNSAGKCQCLFGYWPNGTTCEQFECDYAGEERCSLIYGPDATCSHGKCDCYNTFRLDARTQKCVIDDPNTRPLGGHCVNSDQCGSRASCTTVGECRCHAGDLPETEFTCREPKCSSDEFCHANVTANTVCVDDRCSCEKPIFEEDTDTFECFRVLPDTRLLGAHCANSTYCGEGADCTTGNEQICKCKLGYEATSDTVCERVSCAKNEYCHKTFSPLTFCLNGKCYCKTGYYENPRTLECSPLAPKIGEPCAQKDDEVYDEKPCSSNAHCNKDRKCVCNEGFTVDKDVPSYCEAKPSV